jgi:hypothetical protein
MSTPKDKILTKQVQTSSVKVRSGDLTVQDRSRNSTTKLYSLYQIIA